MASANNALIGALRIEATLDAGKFVDGARKIQKESKQTEATVKSSFLGMGAAMKAGIAGFVGSLTVGYFTNIINQALKYAGSLGEVAQQLGVTTKDLQSFRFMAGQVGVSQEQLETGLSKLTITLGKVAAGAKQPADALKAIGLSAKDVANIDTGEAFRKIADGLSKVTDRSQRAAVEVALFGKTGSMLDNMLAGGSGQINELSAAAEKLGIVLSDEQIQRADDTADKLEALKTVISANIAGAVADNADSIYRLADSIAHLVSQLPNAIQQIKGFYAQFLNFSANVTEKFDEAVMHPLNRFNPLTAPFRNDAMHQTRLRNVQSERAEAAQIDFQSRLNAIPGFSYSIARPSATGSTGSIPQFLASPKSRSAKKTAPVDRTDDVAFQFAQQQRQADLDILHAKQQLAGSAEERAQLELQAIKLEHDMQAADIDDKVRRAREDVANAKDAAEKKIAESVLQETESQAVILKAKNDEATQLKLRAFVEEKLTKAEDANFEAADQQRTFRLDALRAADDAAITAADHRRIQLQILDAEIEQKRLELEHQKQLAIRNGATAEEIKVIQDKIDNLGNERAQGAAGIMRNTQSPLEQWRQEGMAAAKDINAALETIEVQGLDGLSDALTDIITGTASMKEAFHQLAASVLRDLIAMTIKMLIFKAVQAGLSAFGGGGGFDSSVVASNSAAMGVSMPGFASGGSIMVGGRSGTDKNLLSLNGLPIARVSMGERINISNDNGSAFPPSTVVYQTFDLHGAVVTQDLLRQMDEKSQQAAQAGARMGVERMIDLNQRTFGKALG